MPNLPNVSQCEITICPYSLEGKKGEKGDILIHLASEQSWRVSPAESGSKTSCPLGPIE